VSLSRLAIQQGSCPSFTRIQQAFAALDAHHACVFGRKCRYFMERQQFWPSVRSTTARRRCAPRTTRRRESRALETLINKFVVEKNPIDICVHRSSIVNRPSSIVHRRFFSRKKRTN